MKDGTRLQANDIIEAAAREVLRTQGFGGNRLTDAVGFSPGMLDGVGKSPSFLYLLYKRGGLDMPFGLELKDDGALNAESLSNLELTAELKKHG